MSLEDVSSIPNWIFDVVWPVVLGNLFPGLDVSDGDADDSAPVNVCPDERRAARVVEEGQGVVEASADGLHPSEPDRVSAADAAVEADLADVVTVGGQNPEQVKEKVAAGQDERRPVCSIVLLYANPRNLSNILPPRVPTPILRTIFRSDNRYAFPPPSRWQTGRSIPLLPGTLSGTPPSPPSPSSPPEESPPRPRLVGQSGELRPPDPGCHFSSPLLLLPFPLPFEDLLDHCHFLGRSHLPSPPLTWI